MGSISIYALLALLIGLLTLFRIVRALKNPDYLKNYIETSSKAFLWRKIFGVEKTIELTRKIFLPVGLILSIFLIGYGIYVILITLNLS